MLKVINNKIKHREVKNFLDTESFNALKDLVFHEDFNWFRKKSMTDGSKIDLGYFTHSFYNNMEPTSEHYRTYIRPILIKLPVTIFLISLNDVLSISSSFEYAISTLKYVLFFGDTYFDIFLCSESLLKIIFLDG